LDSERIKGIWQDSQDRKLGRHLGKVSEEDLDYSFDYRDDAKGKHLSALHYIFPTDLILIELIIFYQKNS